MNYQEEQIAKKSNLILGIVMTTGKTGGMHLAYKAILLAAPQGALNYFFYCDSRTATAHAVLRLPLEGKLSPTGD